ncbi:phage antirepressor KilAC domain-containing protein [Streptomyces sp. NPDC018019]|uniref:phage antirepressor KilAC domain-containing protein n=1 Tax=Streptomyces sp. NPDC018019 TaxID=3365030 RepID=UPI0037B289D0
MSMVSPAEHSPFEHLKQIRSDGSEYWPARDLQPTMAYDRWERFEGVIERAIAAAENSGADPAAHFRSSAKITKNARGQQRSITDWELSRYGAYLVAMNGDPRKPEIAAAQTYFAVKTREAELRPATPPLPQDYEEALVALLGKVREAKALESKVKELEAPAAAWNVLADASGDYSLRDAAHILNRDPGISTGQHRLMKSIRDLGMVDRKGVPYAKHSTHLVERPQTYQHPHTGEVVLARPQLRITVRGLQYLHSKLGGVAPLRYEQPELGSGDAA